MLPSRWSDLKEPFIGKLTRHSRVLVPRVNKAAWGNNFERKIYRRGTIVLVLKFIPNVITTSEMGMLTIYIGSKVVFMDVQGRWTPSRRFVELC